MFILLTSSESHQARRHFLNDSNFLQSDEGSYCEDSYAEDSVQSEDSLSPEVRVLSGPNQSRDVTSPENDVITVKDDELPSDESVKSRVSSSESMCSGDASSSTSSDNNASSGSQKSEKERRSPELITQQKSERVVETKKSDIVQITVEDDSPKEESSEDDDVNNKYNLLDASDEEKGELFILILPSPASFLWYCFVLLSMHRTIYSLIHQKSDKTIRDEWWRYYTMLQIIITGTK